ncbi:MAG: bifunctional glutamine-synthetase adenylyltransferase/deadenyltransferase [Microbacterium sp. 71-36]|uniref:bifunctional [glutamine synthetase] adenylyltransferase/[glutamine synthetase]-adenylyl-L-tyrosine phosphorylase n=1 Tax=unclassified Microbacterium TaxID=2609290 RepID=UPI00086D3FAA|nr:MULTISPECIES: bifunctional [glutamine synthetase] adenylyltransferase/[glutamine synthetase]-adenylyl-L-tyrosine phosphorylase [unclassified Microbacterium]MBN9211688.1 bifunctional [glutamine synthetase] adenylyltransferase/[glutamine synthetase]-adenylyl-L-tyrosine phosphorylase [Microbacterium sp.]ODT39528.1 MAG: bifunctional glutamine-synthetase adenylyltransferase/deadenyltransferase [Microbacterium sp. SCN 71-17]OJV76990.1 MAG: bifunctional glutamine-synthetase adenylyltransferase/deade
MISGDRSTALTALARTGFSRLAEADAGLGELGQLTGAGRADAMALAQRVADPDRALSALLQIARRDPGAIRSAAADAGTWRALWDIVGASDGFAEFYLRHPDEIAHLAGAGLTVPDEHLMRTELLASVGDVEGFAADATDAAWVALRVRYRRLLARIAAYDLGQDDSAAAIDVVSASLADLAGAALEASLSVARSRVAGTGPAAFPRAQVAATRFAIIAMGKTGARELNYVSDVDVIFVGGTSDEDVVSEARAIDIGTRLAVQTMRGISGPEIEPPLWEVDPNLRPEGKQGALVRSLGAHEQYYARWAKSWEFQALLKARAIAGDAALGAEYIAAVQPLVWQSAARENFVEGVQRMRERVTDHIPASEVNRQVKLGPGGIRDVEFTVQLLQLVHGLTDERIRQRGTLEALDALVAEGYIGRSEAEAFGRDYRLLRLIEHRLQLRGLRRTALLPEKDDDLRVLARATRLADSAAGVQTAWESIKREVRDIHVRLFYRPLLSAVAALPEGERTLSTEQARDRLAAIGFRDPAGALRHIAALTSGLSRKATIQRHLMPIMIRWFADGVDPDYGLLVFRRISERLGNTPWFLRMLRDSAGAAESLTRVLSGSRYIGELMEWIPESVAWLDDDALLRPRSGAALQEEARAIQTRWDDIDGAMRSVRALRRREMLRVAMAAVLEVVSLEELSDALTTITEVTIQATLRAVRREVVPPEDDALDFSVIAMGRFGGREIGFGSDADVMYVYRANGIDPQRASTLALKLVAGLREHSEDHRLPLDLDAELRPEGRSGPLARSLDAYAEYYRRWSLSWEAQALLRARGVAGSVKLIADFLALADDVRYPANADPNGLREIRRIKARVENERLPQGADPARHLKLGPGSISDVEWLVQILQLQHARAVPAMRTTSTLGALQAAVEAGLIASDAAEKLAASWHLASRLRSANTLLSGQTSDVLPADRARLDGIGRILEYPPHSATQVEEDYLGATRRARRVFEKLFYG